MFRRWLRDRRGTTAIEYALIGSLIFVAALTGIQAFGDGTNGVWKRVGTTISASLP